MAKTSMYPWGRCSKAIRNECKNPCKHYLAHHIPPWGHCWCHCEPIERPAEFKHWTGYNKALRFRIQVEGHLTHKRYGRKEGKWVVLGYSVQPSPGDHRDEKDFEHL